MWPIKNALHIILILFFSQLCSFAQDENRSKFIEMCKNPTPAQASTFKAFIKSINRKIPNDDCAQIYEKISRKNQLVLLSHYHYEDLSPLEFLPRVKTLNLPIALLEKNRNLKPLPQIKKLKIYCGDDAFSEDAIKRLNEQFPRITFLTINCHNGGTLQHLQKLDVLKEMRLNIHTIKDLSFLNPDWPVTKLTIRVKRIQSLDGLANLKQLEQLRLFIDFQNDSLDLTGLNWMARLNMLDLMVKDLTNLPELTHLPSLTKIFLKTHHMKDLKPLAYLHNLKILSINARASSPNPLEISDLGPLAGLRQLEHIYINACHVKSLQPLSSLRKLKSLGLVSPYKISEKPLRNLHHLKKVSILKPGERKKKEKEISALALWGSANWVSNTYSGLGFGVQFLVGERTPPNGWVYGYDGSGLRYEFANNINDLFWVVGGGVNGVLTWGFSGGLGTQLTRPSNVKGLLSIHGGGNFMYLKLTLVPGYDFLRNDPSISLRLGFGIVL